jgi:hypothetical protein
MVGDKAESGPISPRCLRKSFTRADPKSIKILPLVCLFALLGSARVKAGSKMLVKSIPEVMVLFSDVAFLHEVHYQPAQGLRAKGLRRESLEGHGWNQV